MMQSTKTYIIKKIINKFCWFSLFLLLGTASSAYAQKIVSFNARTAIFSTQEAQVHSQKLQQQLKPQIDQLKELEQTIQKLQARYESDQFLLSQKEIEQLQENLQAQVAEARKLQQYISNSKTKAERAFENVFFPLLDKVIKTYVKENEISMIINSEAMVYVDKAYDITPDVIQLLDQQ